MQNRYVGDVGDFGKFGLLRRLSGETNPDCPEPRLRIGLVWQLHHDEKHPPGNRTKVSADGRHISYLRRTATDDKAVYRDCDTELWERLRALVYMDGRCVHCAENVGLLPEGSTYFNDQLHFFTSMPRALREQVRACWLRGAFRATADADIVCLDPDNGIAPEDKRYKKDGPKYTFISDLRAFWERGQSLVIYQHMPMDRSARGRTLEIAATLHEEFGVEPIPMLFSRGTSRTFFVIPQPDQQEILECRIVGMLGTHWREHFEWVR